MAAGVYLLLTDVIIFYLPIINRFVVRVTIIEGEQPGGNVHSDIAA